MPRGVGGGLQQACAPNSYGKIMPLLTNERHRSQPACTPAALQHHGQGQGPLPAGRTWHLLLGSSVDQLAHQKVPVLAFGEIDNVGLDLRREGGTSRRRGAPGEGAWRCGSRAPRRQGLPGARATTERDATWQGTGRRASPQRVHAVAQGPQHASGGCTTANGARSGRQHVPRAAPAPGPAPHLFRDALALLGRAILHAELDDAAGSVVVGQLQELSLDLQVAFEEGGLWVEHRKSGAQSIAPSQHAYWWGACMLAAGRHAHACSNAHEARLVCNGSMPRAGRCTLARMDVTSCFRSASGVSLGRSFSHRVTES